MARSRPLWTRRLAATALVAVAVAGPSWGADKAAYSPTEVRPLLIGTEVPSVDVLALDGATIDLRKTIGKKPAVVIFYRGGW